MRTRTELTRALSDQRLAYEQSDWAHLPLQTAAMWDHHVGEAVELVALIERELREAAEGGLTR